MKHTIKLAINGTVYDFEVPANESLVETLRKRAGLTGTKKGCESGECGACTVLLNGRPVCSCLILSCTVSGAQITTIEGLGTPENLHPVQKAFVDAGAIQCGFCTPGMVLTTVALLEACPDPSDADIKKWLAGNMCRCTGYTKILDAVRLASSAIRLMRAAGT